MNDITRIYLNEMAMWDKDKKSGKIVVYTRPEAVRVANLLRNAGFKANINDTVFAFLDFILISFDKE